MNIVVYVLLGIYISFIIVALIVGRNEIKKQVIFMMLISSLLLIVVLILSILGIELISIILLFLGLLSIQIASIINGYQLNNKLNLKHQIVRFIFHLFFIISFIFL